MLFSEVLLLMRSGQNRRADPGSDTHIRMRGFAGGGCGWPQMSCSPRDDGGEDEEDYYGSEPRPRSLALEDNKGAGVQEGTLDTGSPPSFSESGTRTPQCRICFQGPEKVNL